MTLFSLRILPAARATLLLTVAVLGLSALEGRAAEPAIIAKARSFIGTEAALQSVKSIHYQGTLVLTDTDAPSNPRRAAVDIVFQKPDQQRISSISDKLIEVTALDGYDAWQRQQEPADPTKWQQTLLGPDQIKRLRANTWENLFFFRGIEARGGKIEEKGSMSLDGVDCAKLAFTHAPNIIFYRYFDKATGRLVFTETEAGSTIREVGEMTVNGLRMPKSIITTTKISPTQTQTITITFDKVTVNEVFPASYFAAPALLTK